MTDCRKNFITIWNRLNKRHNELVETFTLTEEEYTEFKLTVMKINALLDDGYYFGFETLKAGQML